MENTELIDKYLSGGMSEGEIQQFEQTLSADPLLKKDFEFQQSIVDGIKTVRLNELKASLNTIDVSGLITTTTIWSVKTITAVAVISIGGIASYFFMNENATTIPPTLDVEEINNPQSESVVEEINTNEINELDVNSKPEQTEQPKLTTEHKTPISFNLKNEDDAARSSEVNDDFGDFEEDNINQSTAPVNYMISKGEFEHATIDVVISNTKKKYSFHYQIKDNTLFLYGTFENIYEVLEFKHGEKNDLYFFYNSLFYDIKESQVSIAPLEEMTVEETMELKQKINSGNAAKSQ